MDTEVEVPALFVAIALTLRYWADSSLDTKRELVVAPDNSVQEEISTEFLHDNH